MYIPTEGLQGLSSSVYDGQTSQKAPKHRLATSRAKHDTTRCAARHAQHYLIETKRGKLLPAYAVPSAAFCVRRLVINNTKVIDRGFLHYVQVICPPTRTGIYNAP